MGTTQTTQSTQSFYQKLIHIKTIDSLKSLMRDPQSQQIYAVVQHTFPSQQQMNKFSLQLTHRKNIYHQYYMNTINQLIISTNNLCSKQYKIIQIFKWQEYTLYDQILSRKQENKIFTDRQIWSILCSCVLTMSYFTKNQIIHHTLNPKDIILTLQGQVKILANQLSQYYFDYTYKHGFYYAPQTLKAINNRNLYTLTNKASVFTLGLTILSAITVQDLCYLYKDGNVIDFVQIKRLIQTVTNIDIKNVLNKMLKNAAYQRISFTQLQEMLYEILQHNQLLGQNQAQQQQIQKLQESIYRLKTKQQIQQPIHSINNGIIQPMDNDQQDQPNYISAYYCVDTQNMDEIDMQKSRDQTTQGSRTVAPQEYKPISDSKLRVPLIDKSNSIQISQSLKIVDDNNQKYNYLVGLTKSKNSRQLGPYYVTQQYSRGKYQGYKQNGMRHGFGTFYYQQGGKYSGEWCKNKMQGRGALYYTNGQLAYQGQWNQDQLHGYGVLYNQTPVYVTENIDWKQLDKITSCWVKYQGNFVKDLKHGEGTLFLSNGEYFRGQFKTDIPNGKGIFRTLNNYLIKGSWKNGVFENYQQ